MKLPRRRFLQRVSVLLLLGAAVNVAVAMALATRLPVWPNQKAGPSNAKRIYDEVWLSKRPPEFPEWIRTDWSATTFVIGLESSFLLAERSDIGEYTIYTLRYMRSGWPMKSLAGGEWRVDQHRPGRMQTRTLLHAVRATEVSSSQNGMQVEPLVFPISPIWPGFFLNAGFYALPLWLGMAAIVRWRRHRRMLRGICPDCAYPVGVSEVCSECGAAVKRGPST